MSRNYAIISHMKLRGAEAHNGVLAEANRAIFGNNIDKGRTHKNIIIIKNKYKNYDDFVQTKRAEMEKANKDDRIWNQQNPDDKKKYRRFPRRTLNKKTNKKEEAALSQQIVFTHSPGIMSEDDSITYLKSADKFIREWFADNEVISSIIHLDETTAHLHVDIAFFDKNNKRFNQKILSETGMTDYNKIRAAFQEKVADRFGLIAQDGSVVKKGTHEQRADLNRAADKEKLANAKNEISKAKNETYLINMKKDHEIKKLQADEEQSRKIISDRDNQIANYITLLAEKEKQIVELENKKLETIEVEVVKIVRDDSDVVEIKNLKNKIEELKKENEEFIRLPSMNDWEKRNIEIKGLREENKKLSLEIKNLPTVESFKRIQYENKVVEVEKEALKTKNKELEELLEMAKLQIKDLADKLKATVLKFTDPSKQKVIKKSKISIPSILDEYSENDLETTLRNEKIAK